MFAGAREWAFPRRRLKLGTLGLTSLAEPRPVNQLATVLTSVSQRRPVAVLWVIAVLFAIVTFGLRAINLNLAFDIYFDEVVYTHISLNMVHTLEMTYNGQTAYLHPPLFYFLEGGYLALFGSHLDPIHLIFVARYLNVIFASLSASLLFLIGRRVAGWQAGVIAAAIFALDPFVIKMNSRNLLETGAMFWVLVGYAILLHSRDRWISGWRMCGAGCAFGAALLTEEETAFHTLVPLAICFVFNWAIPRRAAVIVSTITCLLYSFYPLVLAAKGQLQDFIEWKFGGVQRLIGTYQASGYNAQNAPSFIATPFVEAILRNLAQFATTYSLLGAFGIIAIAVLFRQRDPASRLVAIWVASAYALQAYSVKFGTNEEQYYYYVVVTAILATATAGVLTIRSSRLTGRSRLWAGAAAALLLTACIGWSGRIWVERHTTPDNANQRLFAYLERYVPPGSRIAAATLTSDALMSDYNYVFGYWWTVPALKRNHVQYVVASTGLIENGYEMASPQFYDWLTHNARLVYAFRGPSNGLLGLYRLRKPL